MNSLCNRVSCFFSALKIFFKLYKDGFYFTENEHPNTQGGHWGFYRLNHVCQTFLLDIDYDMDKDGYGYFHIHGDGFCLEKPSIGRVHKVRTIRRCP